MKKLVFALSMLGCIGVNSLASIQFDSGLIEEASKKQINVYVDEEKVIFEDQNPINENSRVLIPLRGVFEKMGIEVKWDNDLKTVFASNGLDKISMRIGDNILWKNGKEVLVDVPATLINNKTMVPIRVVAQSFDAVVKWNGEENSVYITSKKSLYDIDKVELKETLRSGKFTDEVKVVYPVIKNLNNSEIIKKVNLDLKLRAEKDFEILKEEARFILGDLGDLQDIDGISTEFVNEIDFGVGYESEDILSVSNLGYQYSGGAHGGAWLKVYNYNMKTGDLLTINEFMGLSEEEVSNLIRQYTLEKIDSDPEMFFEWSKEYINSEEFNPFSLPWNMTKDSVIVTYGQYELAPYVEGMIEVEIPLNR